ncbi:MAG: hypothetical protein J6C33_08755 [Lachnospiraceae bacterium]|nr:hypothetical protein [Lachnospiraceae bacterium]
MKKTVLFSALFLLTAVLAGCGKTDDALDEYKSAMTEFTDHIEELVTSIDNIDLESETRTQEMLGYLDEMDAAFTEMSELTVPEQFANIDELADDASANLSQAVALYHEAFDHEDDYDPQLIDAALEYYNRAFKRLDYIGTILQGELPEDESITIIHADEDGSEDETPEEGGGDAAGEDTENNKGTEETDQESGDAVG